MRESSESSPRVVPDAVCTNCCCICDDIELEVRGGAIREARGACALGQQWFKTAGQQSPQSTCRVDGQEATLDASIQAAAEMLQDARYPLVYGLTHCSSEAQRVAAGLADRLHAVIDSVTSSSHGPSIIGFQSVGKVTCSLGETRNRADLIIFWGTNVVEEHPRFFTHYSAEATGMLVPRGRADRHVVLIGAEPNATAERCDRFYQIKPDSDYEVLSTLRALARGIEPDAERVLEQTGIPLAEWAVLADRMKACGFGSIAFGLGLMRSRGEHANTEALFSLVADMNEHTRFVCRSIRRRGNVTGADKVLGWRTGYPFAVNLTRGYPRYNPGEYSATEVLARGEVDAALVIAADPLADLSPAAADHLASTPYIYIGPHDNATSRRARVHIPTATYGIHTPGTVYRTDDIPFALTPVLESQRSSEVEIINALLMWMRSPLGGKTGKMALAADGQS